jgi:hypothetical protein
LLLLFGEEKIAPSVKRKKAPSAEETSLGKEE